MRFSWLVTAGVCSWLVACSASSHKKVLLCDASECGPDQDAAQSEGGAGSKPDSGDKRDAGEDAETTPDADTEVDAGSDAQMSEAGATGGDSELEIAIEGSGSVTVASAASCLTARCNYPTNPGTKLTLQAKPSADARFVGWSGDCAGSATATSVTVNGSMQCVATFATQRAVALAVSAEGGGSVQSSPDLACTALACHGQVDNHSTVTITAKPLPGFRFVAWSGSPECRDATQAVLPIGITQDLSCTASFAKQFTLAVSALGASAQVAVVAGACNALSCTADGGARASFRAEPAAGFRFTGWTGDSACTGIANPLDIASVNSDLTCIANYAGRLSATGVVATGFSGDVAASSASISSVCARNSCLLDAGSSATLLAPTIAGFRLKNWTGGGCDKQNGNGVIVTPTTDNVACTANYEAGVSVTGNVIGGPPLTTISATSASPGASCSAGACGIASGGSVSLTAPNLLPGYRFLGWTGDSGCASAVLAITLSNVTTSKSCSANYVQQFTIASTANAGGTVSAKTGTQVCAGNSCTVDAGANVALSALPDTTNGYHFSGWSGVGCSPGANNPLTLSNVNAVCVASFDLDTFTIAATAGINGSVTATRSDTSALCPGNSCTVNSGVGVELKAEPSANFSFAGWSGAGCLPTDSPTLSLKNVNVNCTAAFAINAFSASVSATPVNGGSVGITCPAGNCSAVPAGQTVNVTANPNMGWSFAGWSSNCGAGTTSPLAVMINAPTACVATFRPRVNAAVVPAGAGSIKATGTPNATCMDGNPGGCAVDSGGTVTLVAQPATDSVFVNWTGDCSGTNPSTTLNGVAVPKNCTANFYRLWAQSSGAPGNDGMANVVSLGDGTVVGSGLSLVVGGKSGRLALVALDANTGSIGANTLFSDDAVNSSLVPLGLTATQNQKSVVALGMHTSSAGKLPWLHNEEKKWEFDYKYLTNGATNAVGGEVIGTTDGGYAFTVGVVDPSPIGAATISMAHLTKVDASGKPVFDAKFCANKSGCLPTLPVDVVQDPINRSYTVLSQVLMPTPAFMLTTIDEGGGVKGSTIFVDAQAQEVRVTQFVPSSTADSFLVVGSRVQPRTSTTSAFVARVARGDRTPIWAYSVGDDSNEDLLAITRSGSTYGLAGVCPDAKGGTDAWLALIDEDGSIKNQVSYGAIGDLTLPLSERANAISALPAGGFALGGNTTSWGFGFSDMWTLRVDPKGDIAFNRSVTPTAVLTSTRFTATPIALTGSEDTLPSLVTMNPTQLPFAAMANVAQFRQVAQAP